MLVTTGGSTLRLLLWQWRNTLLFTIPATAIVAANLLLDWTWMRLPTVPLAVVGGAVGIFVSFRTNSAYDRWWEGRKLWGRLINSSRHFGTQVMSYLPQESDAASRTQKELVRRHIAYVHALRTLLRKQDPFADDEFKAFVESDPKLKGQSNLTHALLTKQLKQLTALSDAETFDDFRLSNFELTIRSLLDIQGGCERIKKTPLPRGYAFIAERLIQYFGLLFPMAIVSDLGWATIPVNLLVCMAFALISEAGRVLEDPFTLFWNGLPLSAMSRTIELNLLQCMGETENLPELLKPNEKGVLM